MITKTVSRDRSKIVLEWEDQIKYWIKHLGVTRDELGAWWQKWVTLPPQCARSLPRLKSRFDDDRAGRRRLLIQCGRSVWLGEDAGPAVPRHVRFWHKADIRTRSTNVRPKADITGVSGMSGL